MLPQPRTGNARTVARPDPLTADERRQLVENGWGLLPRVLRAEQIERLHAAWDHADAARSDTDHNWGPELSREPAVDECRDNARVLAAARLLVAAEVRVPGAHGRSPPRGHGRQGAARRHCQRLLGAGPDGRQKRGHPAGPR
jgi:hypothetical protein